MSQQVNLRQIGIPGIPLGRNRDLRLGEVRLHWLGQAGFLLETSETRVLVDPYLSDSLATKYRGKAFPHTRMMAVPVRPDQLAEIDLVVVTHAHSDHMDPETLGIVARGNPACRFVVPEAVRSVALERGVPEARLVGAKAFERLRPAAGCTLDPIPSAHEELKQNEAGEHFFLGYVITWAEVAIYHAGDCCPYPGLLANLRRQRVDLALLPVNGRDSVRTASGILGNFTLTEAIDLVRDARLPWAIGHHYGMFDFNTIDPEAARAEIRAAGLEMAEHFLMADRNSRFELSAGKVQTHDKESPMSDMYDAIKAVGLVPVIKLDRVEDAEPLGKALMDGGLRIAEITFRTDAAAESIRRLRAKFPDMIVGAGTILTLDQAKASVDAGSSFAVTPGFNPRIVEFFHSKGIPVVPGVNSPSQVEMGLEMGLKVLKFFPAEASGGVKMLKALQGPYADVRFMPTGGVDESNLASYLALGNVLACGGSWMVKDELIRQGKFDEISRLSLQAVELVKKIRTKA